MPPRMPAFTRKGASAPAPSTIAKPPNNGADDPNDRTQSPSPDGTADTEDTPEISGNDEQHDPQAMAVCPSCGCVFNDDTGKVLNEDHPQYPREPEGAATSPAGGPDV